MKKIFFEERKIIISDHISEIPQPDCPSFEVETQCEIDAFLKLFLQDEKPCYQLIAKDEKLAFTFLKQNFSLVEAAGGAVFNEKGELLVIERFGRWDLPKGHIESGEKAKEAAIREVEEECGVTAPRIEGKLCNTWHTFYKNGKHKLKKTHWYKMSLEGRPELTPQTEEGITNVKWVAETEMPEILANTWGSLIDVFGAAAEMYK